MSEPGQPSSVPARGARLVLAVSAVAVLVAGAPNLAGQVAALPGRQAADLLSRGRVPGEEGFERLLRSRRQALAFTGDPSWHVDSGAALLARALASGGRRADVTDTLREARDRLRAGLTRAPADDIGWLWLAVAETRLGEWREAASALRLSLTTAPVDHQIALPRAVVELVVWPWLDSATRPLVAHDLANALERSPDDLVAVAGELGRRRELHDVLVDDAKASARLVTAEQRSKDPS